MERNYYLFNGGNMPAAGKGMPDNVAELKQKEVGEPIAGFLRMELAELSPGYARVTMKVSAECRVVRSGRCIGVSEMTVTDQDGKLIAKATGTTITTA